MKEKLQKEVIKIGTTNVDHNNLSVIEAISLSAVAVLAIIIGTMYGDKLF